MRNNRYFLCIALLVIFLYSSEREPMLNLHQGGKDITMDMPVIDLKLDVYWDYQLKYDVVYDWKAEWLYGWDEKDQELFGSLDYTMPTEFNIRRYFTGEEASNSYLSARILACSHDIAYYVLRTYHFFTFLLFYLFKFGS